MITIKNIELDNLDKLAELFDSYRVFYEKESNLAEGKSFLKERITNNVSQIFVSYDNNGEMTGFVQLYPIFSSTRMKRLWLLNDLFVDSDYRGLGISKALIEKAKEFCRATNSCGIILETSKSNLIGNSLYPSTAFELDNEHNYYYWDNELRNKDLNHYLFNPAANEIEVRYYSPHFYLVAY